MNNLIVVGYGKSVELNDVHHLLVLYLIYVVSSISYLYKCCCVYGRQHFSTTEATRSHHARGGRVTDDPHLPTFEKCPKTIFKFTKRIGYIGQEAV